MRSTTASIALASLLSGVAVAILIAVLPLWWPDSALAAGAASLGMLGAAIAAGGGAGAVGHGIRHYGSRAPTSAMMSAAPDPDVDAPDGL